MSKPSSEATKPPEVNPWPCKWFDTLTTRVKKQQEQANRAREAKRQGLIWNPKTKEWYLYKLDNEWNELQQERHESTVDGPVEPEKDVHDREYYELLGVSTNADASALKKAYYKAARSCHPDKHPNDPEAHAKFQQLGHAYQILSNPETRAHYDQHGKEGESEAPMAEMDPFVFFNVMFGSTLVEPYIGELWLASQTNSMMKDSSLFQDLEDEQNLTEEERHARMEERVKKLQDKNEWEQRKRYVTCAKNLKKRLSTYDPKNPKPFQEGCREEAAKLVEGAYGGLYGNTVGFALRVAAEEYLGDHTTPLGLGGTMARTRKGASGFKSGCQLLGAGIKAATAGSRAMQQVDQMSQQGAAERAEPTAEEQKMMAETIDDSLPAFLGFAWAINKRDIQTTIMESCRRLLDDADVSQRVDVARALQILGKEFHTAGRQAMRRPSQQQAFGAEDIKARMAVASMTTMAKAQGQEMTKEDQDELFQQHQKMAKAPHVGDVEEKTTKEG